MLSGGCFCGAVRYAVKGGTFHSSLWHCSDCRRVAEAPVVAWFSPKVADFRVVAGAAKSFRSSAKVARLERVRLANGLVEYERAWVD
jgi:hypothetical protein